MGLKLWFFGAPQFPSDRSGFSRRSALHPKRVEKFLDFGLIEPSAKTCSAPILGVVRRARCNALAPEARSRRELGWYCRDSGYEERIVNLQKELGLCADAWSSWGSPSASKRSLSAAALELGSIRKVDQAMKKQKTLRSCLQIFVFLLMSLAGGGSFAQENPPVQLTIH